MNSDCSRRVFYGILVTLAIFKSASAIECYVCDATDTSQPFQCSEWFERYDTPDIEVNDCSDVHDAQFCIKHVGRFEATSIKCYQCRVADTIDCADAMIAMSDSALQPTECDHVIDAEYCVKSTSLDGGIGAKRYCSSKDLGNYCNYVQNIGDQMEYRSCIYTCGTDGCNSSSGLVASTGILIAAIFVYISQIL